MTPSITLTHTGVYGDGRPNNSSVLIKDLDFGFEFQTRKELCYVPVGSSITIPYTDKSAYSLYQGDIFKFVSWGLIQATILGFGLEFSSTILTTAGTYPISVGLIQRYDASLLAPNALVIEFPDNPQTNETIGLKEVGNSAVSILVDGNGFDLEGIGFPPAATQNLNIPLLSVTLKFDGSIWRIL